MRTRDLSDCKVQPLARSFDSSFLSLSKADARTQVVSCTIIDITTLKSTLQVQDRTNSINMSRQSSSTFPMKREFNDVYSSQPRDWQPWKVKLYAALNHMTNRNKTSALQLAIHPDKIDTLSLLVDYVDLLEGKIA